MASDADHSIWNSGTRYWLQEEVGSYKFMVERHTGTLRLIRPLDADPPERDHGFLFTVCSFSKLTLNLDKFSHFAADCIPDLLKPTLSKIVYCVFLLTPTLSINLYCVFYNLPFKVPVGS